MAAPAAAHEVEIQGATPAPGAVLDESPSVVTIIFTEELVDGESSFQVLDTEGNAVDDGDASLDLNDPEHATLVAHISRAMPDGIYTVHYRVKVLDGDVTVDEYRFAIGNQYTGQALVPAAGEKETDDPEVASSSAPESPPADAQGSGAPFMGIAFTTIALIILAFVIVFAVRRRSPSPVHHDDA